MRDVFANKITELALDDNRIIIIVGDFGYKKFERLKAERPKQWLNVGIAEQMMIGMAAGMAMEGLRPVVFTITPFIIRRAFEQVYLDVAQQYLPVLLCGFDDYPKDGPTHQGNNAEMLSVSIPKLLYVRPDTAEEVEHEIECAILRPGPTFLHLTRTLAKTPQGIVDAAWWASQKEMKAEGV